MTVVVATIQRGRRDHLRRQIAALERSEVQPAGHVIVSMDDVPPEPASPRSDVLHLPVADGEPLPLAAARNLAIRHAHEAHGAELVVLLDVDCLPSPGLLGAYVDAAVRRPGALLAGAVRYLPSGVPSGEAPLPSPAELATAPPHPARPVPAPGELLDEPRIALFWSLSFAVRPRVHARFGGFDEAYAGYGGEDTDYAMRAARAGVGFVWVGGAEAYHQHHPVSDPPVEHVDEIVRNARRYHARWGAWPMAGWLGRFRELGLVEWQESGDSLTRTSTRAAGIRG